MRMKNRPFITSFFIALSVLLSACVPKEQYNNVSENNQASSSLTETYWKLVQLNGVLAQMVVGQEREQYFVLESQNKQVRGVAGCNSFFGQFETTQSKNSDSLQFKTLGATKMACPDAEIDEQAYLTVFGDTAHYKIVGETLTLLDHDRVELATFNSVYLH